MAVSPAQTDQATTAPTATSGRVARVFSRVPIHPPLFAIYPVLLLYSDNVAEVDLAELIVPVVVVLGLTLLLQLLLTAIAHDARRAAFVTTATVLPAMLFGAVRVAFAGGEVRGSYGALYGTAIALAVTLLCVSVGLYLASKPRWAPSLTQALNLGSSILVVLTLIPVVTFASATMQPTGGSTTAPRGSEITAEMLTAPEAPRDIYHLVFDRYGSDAALRVEHGIDNSDFAVWLEEHGFDVVERSRANYVETPLSLSSTLALSPADKLAEALGKDNPSYAPLFERITNSHVGSLLQDLGYSYVHIGSYYGPTRSSNVADSSRYPGSHVSFANALFSRSILTLIDEGLPSNRHVAESAEYQFAELESLSTEPGPKYVFAHILLPHPPFVYLEDGTYAEGEAVYASQLAYTNTRIRELVELLLAKPEAERPIIILQGDEGPVPERYAADEEGFDWRAATDEELVMKFGILNAMFLPGPEGAVPMPDDLTAVNTYTQLFRRYFGADIDDLPDASYSSTVGKPYDLIDITERLDRAEAALSVGTDPPAG